MVLSDNQAKQILRSHWPSRSSKKWPIPGYTGKWMRACPINGSATLPFLRPPGGSVLTTNPDGMYIFVSHPPPPSTLRFADVIAIEICCDTQNFRDKRSRYNPIGTELALPLNWLHHRVALPNGGVREAWNTSEWYNARPQSEQTYAVRHLRALFALPDADYKDVATNLVLFGHEYFCMHKQLNQFTGQTMQRFIKGMALMKQFSTKPR